MPVASFAPEMIELFVRASTEAVTVGPFPRRQAMALRFRLNSLRQAMRDENHHALPAAEACQVRLVAADASGAQQFVEVSPSDNIFAEAIRAAGVRIDVPSLSPVAPPNETPTGEEKGSTWMDDYFDTDPDPVEELPTGEKKA